MQDFTCSAPGNSVSTAPLSPHTLRTRPPGTSSPVQDANRWTPRLAWTSEVGESPGRPRGSKAVPHRTERGLWLQVWGAGTVRQGLTGKSGRRCHHTWDGTVRQAGVSEQSGLKHTVLVKRGHSYPNGPEISMQKERPSRQQRAKLGESLC